jgi:hypothetical protein
LLGLGHPQQLADQFGEGGAQDFQFAGADLIRPDVLAEY